MKNNNQLFYLRQFVHLMAKGEEPRTAFNILVNEVPKSQLESWQQAHTIYEATQSLERAFEKLDIGTSSPIIEQLRRGKELGLNEQEVLQHFSVANSSEMQIAQIIKSRLIRILSYSAFLSVIALVILNIFSFYVIPTYTNLLVDESMYPTSLVYTIDALRMQSWWSLLLYLPPILIIGVFVIASLSQAEAFTRNRIITRLPLMKGIAKQLGRVNFIQNLRNFHKRLPDNNAELVKTINTPFFSSSDQFTFDELFNEQEKEQLLALLKLDTFEQESSELIGKIETQAIESSHQKTGIIAILLHLLLIYIVYQIVSSIYLPIFQLGTGF